MNHHELGPITGNLIDIGLTDKNASGGCCGGGGCACSPGTATAADAAAAGTVTTLAVTGMTCGHCVSSITEELGEVDGIESVTVELNAGGVSTVTVTSTTAIEPDALRTAVTEAGYALADA